MMFVDAFVVVLAVLIVCALLLLSLFALIFIADVICAIFSSIMKRLK